MLIFENKKLKNQPNIIKFQNDIFNQNKKNPKLILFKRYRTVVPEIYLNYSTFTNFNSNLIVFLMPGSEF